MLDSPLDQNTGLHREDRHIAADGCHLLRVDDLGNCPPSRLVEGCSVEEPIHPAAAWQRMRVVRQQRCHPHAQQRTRSLVDHRDDAGRI